MKVDRRQTVNLSPSGFSQVQPLSSNRADSKTHQSTRLLPSSHQRFNWLQIKDSCDSSLIPPLFVVFPIFLEKCHGNALFLSWSKLHLPLFVCLATFQEPKSFVCWTTPPCFNINEAGASFEFYLALRLLKMTCFDSSHRSTLGFSGFSEHHLWFPHRQHNNCLEIIKGKLKYWKQEPQLSFVRQLAVSQPPDWHSRFMLFV